MVLVDVRSTCWLVQDEERKAMKPVPTEREDDRLVTEQTLNPVCEMKVKERGREAAIARPLAWGLKVARPVASRETSSLGVKGLPAPLMITLVVVFLAECSKTWNRALLHGPPGPLASGPSSELGAQDRLRTRNRLRTVSHGTLEALWILESLSAPPTGQVQTWKQTGTSPPSPLWSLAPSAAGGYHRTIKVRASTNFWVSVQVSKLVPALISCPSPWDDLRSGLRCKDLVHHYFRRTTMVGTSLKEGWVLWAGD